MVQLRSRFSQWIRGDFRLLLVGLILSRLLVLPWRVSLLVGSAKYYDYRHYFELAQMSAQGFYPYVHYWMEYPPVFPWLVVAAYKVSVWLATGPAAEACFYALISGLLVACEVGSFVLLYRLARVLSGPETAWRSALLYLLLFVPVYLWTGWFDSLPTFLLLSALYLLITQRERLSAVAAGLGLVTKVFPALALPLALCSLPGWPRKLVYSAIVAGVVGIIVLPLLVVNSAMLWVSVQAMLGRPSWETVWAILEGYYGGGAVARFAQRLDPASAIAGSHASSLPWALVTLVFGLLYLVFYGRFWGTRNRLPIIAAAGFTLHLLLLYSKGYSPQYLTWLAPLLVIVFPNRRGAVYLGLLSLINLLEYPGYFHFFPEQHALLAGIVLARAALLIIVALDYLARALPRRELAPTG